jgi:hypothetical protein
MTLIDMFAHATKILNTNSHPAAELRGIYSIKTKNELLIEKDARIKLLEELVKK